MTSTQIANFVLAHTKNLERLKTKLDVPFDKGTLSFGFRPENQGKPHSRLPWLEYRQDVQNTSNIEPMDILKVMEASLWEIAEDTDICEVKLAWKYPHGSSTILTLKAEVLDYLS